MAVVNRGEFSLSQAEGQVGVVPWRHADIGLVGSQVIRPEPLFDMWFWRKGLKD